MKKFLLPLLLFLCFSFVYADTGGTITTIINNSVNYTVHTFTGNSSYNVTSAKTIEILMIAGAGSGGGNNNAGGGGAGGLYFNASYSVTPGNYTVVIGDGGKGTSADLVGKNGTNSSIMFSTPLHALGGGGGGAASGSFQRGANGGSGGGNSFALTTAAGLGLQNSSFSGGRGQNGGAGGNAGAAFGAGGGGGAKQDGAAGTAGAAGSGGNGLEYNLTGTPTNYSGGGGGGSNAGAAAAGGAGGGGTGAVSATSNCTVGAANTGGGGGGSTGGTFNVGCDGGSGIIIIRYIMPAPTVITANLTNAVNGSKIDVFSVNISNTTTSTVIHTTNGTAIGINITGNITINWYNIINGSGGSCYQEFANLSTACGGVGSGSYNQSRFGVSSTNNSWKDGDFGTFDNLDGMNFVVNYTKPGTALNTSQWRIKDSAGERFVNISATCWSPTNDPNTLQFNITTINANPSIFWRCFNGTAFEILSNIASGSFDVYEEGMNWSMSNPSYFNVSHTLNVIVGSSVSVTNSTFQAWVNLSVYRLFLNNSIATFNTTNNLVTNQTSISSVMIKSLLGTNNIKVDVAGNYSKNITCSPTTPLSTIQCNATGIYDNLFTIGAAIGGTGISTFSVTVTNNSIGASSTGNTTNGSLVFPLLQGYYYQFFLTPSSNFTLANATLPTNASTHLYNFSVFVAQTVSLTLREEITRNLLNNVNFSFSLISNVNATTYNITNGTLFFSLLLPNNYTFRYSSTDYPERDYYLNLLAQSLNNITLYAISFNDSSDVLVTVKDTQGNPIEGAIVKLLRYYVYCNCYEVVEMAETSFSGQAFFNAEYYEGHYKWSVDIDGVNEFFSTSPENLVPGNDQTIVTRTIIVNLGEDYYSDYVALSNIGYACVFNSTTGGLTLSWSDPENLVTRGCIDASYISGIEYVSVGENCQDASTGSVVITINTSIANKYQGILTLDGQEYTICAGWIDDEPFSFGDVGIFFAIGIMITLVIAFSFSAIGVLIITVAGVFFISLFGIMTFDTSFLTGLSVLVLGLGIYVMRS